MMLSQSASVRLIECINLTAAEMSGAINTAVEAEPWPATEASAVCMVVLDRHVVITR